MSKAECNRAYLSHKMAQEASLWDAIKTAKNIRVSEVFMRKPYSSSNYAVYPGEKEMLRKLYKKRWYEAHKEEYRERYQKKKGEEKDERQSLA